MMASSVPKLDLPATDDARPADLAELFAEEYLGMVRLATLLVDDQARAEELVQDAFVRVHRRWARIDNPGAYLRTAVVNACRSHLRRRRLARHRDPLLHADADRVASQDPDELTDALAALPYRRRAAIVLRYYADLPDAEIAAAIGVRPPTVRTLIHRGLADLRKDLPR